MSKVPTFYDGQRVWYQLAPDRRYKGVVDGEPWLLGDHSWVVNLREMSDKYQREVRARTRVNAAFCDSLIENEDDND